jgi:hypothetical protein
MLAFFAFLHEFTTLSENMPLAYTAFLATITPSSAIYMSFTTMFDWATREVATLLLWSYAF